MAKAATSGANLGFEAKLFLTADKLRGSMDASEYKHVALGLIFLKYISDAFTSIYERLKVDMCGTREISQNAPSGSPRTLAGAGKSAASVYRAIA